MAGTYYYSVVEFLQQARNSKVFGEIDFQLSHRHLLLYSNSTAIIHLLLSKYNLLPFRADFFNKHKGFAYRTFYSESSFGAVPVIQDMSGVIDDNDSICLDIRRKNDFELAYTNTYLHATIHSLETFNIIYNQHHILPDEIKIIPLLYYVATYDLFKGEVSDI